MFALFSILMFDLIAKTQIEKRVATLITPILIAKGYDVVRVRFFSQSRPRTLQIMAEDNNGNPIDLDACTLLSRLVSVALDTENVLSEAYNLEMSSPGIDRPLTRVQDFTNWCGHYAKIHVQGSQDGRRHYNGRLLRVQNHHIVLDCCFDQADIEIAVPLHTIASAKLVLSPDLLNTTESTKNKETSQ